MNHALLKWRVHWLGHDHNHQPTDIHSICLSISPVGILDRWNIIHWAWESIDPANSLQAEQGLCLIQEKCPEIKHDLASYEFGYRPVSV